MKRTGMGRLLSRMAVVAGMMMFALTVTAQVDPPGGGTNSSPSYTPLDTWSFYDTNNWTSDAGYSPVSFGNLSISDMGDGIAMVIDTNLSAWLQFNCAETNGSNEISVATGSIMFWVAPNWSSTNFDGYGPGVWGRLLEVGAYTPDSSLGWWSLYTDDVGCNLYFSAQTNDSSGNAYTISAPISWATNRWHFVALTYSRTNVSLFIDGSLMTNDVAGLTVWPGSDVLSNGFFIGSDSNGVLQAHAMVDDIRTYDTVVDATTIASYFSSQQFIYYMNPKNRANSMVSAQSSASTYTPFNDVYTGLGNLTDQGAASSCVTDTNIWITNTVVGVANGKMTITFTIAGGSDNTPYDIFANSILSLSGSNSIAWAWMGQGYHCRIYTLTNLPSTSCYLLLASTYDGDGDGLTDAFEKLVSHTNPNSYSSDGSGLPDGWEWFFFGQIGIDPNADPDGDGLSNYQEFTMYSGGYNPTKWDSNTNSVSDAYEDFSGDGLANFMEPAFGGNMMTNTPAWKIDWNGAGMPDSYKVMIGISTNTAESAPGLPAYSKNPLP